MKPYKTNDELAAELDVLQQQDAKRDESPAPPTSDFVDVLTGNWGNRRARHEKAVAAKAEARRRRTERGE